MILLNLILIPFLWFNTLEGDIFLTKNGQINFVSDAPLEIIKAYSKKMNGKIDTSRRVFSFQIEMNSFEGFNSGLQKVHFKESFLETETYKYAEFNGKIIEPIDFSVNGKHKVRAKGLLKIHGEEKERIIRSNLEVRGNKLIIDSKFTVLLTDHNIYIPKIINQKIANEISVKIKAEFLKQE